MKQISKNLNFKLPTDDSTQTALWLANQSRVYANVTAMPKRIICRADESCGGGRYFLGASRGEQFVTNFNNSLHRLLIPLRGWCHRSMSCTSRSITRFDIVPFSLSTRLHLHILCNRNQRPAPNLPDLDCWLSLVPIERLAEKRPKRSWKIAFLRLTEMPKTCNGSF